MGNKTKSGAPATADALSRLAEEESNLRIEYTPLSVCLTMAHKRNPKEHDLPALVASFRRFGFTAPPMVDEATSTMVAGHGRCAALAIMRDAGESPPNRIRVTHQGWMVPVYRGVSFKSDVERDAYVIADNQHTIHGGWNLDALSELVNEIRDSDFGLDGLGFDVEDLESFGFDDDDNDALDDGSGPNGPPKLVNVGAHTRLLNQRVRDLTDDDWTLHLGDCLEGLKGIEANSVDAVITDPPAGISFMSKGWDDDKGGRDKWIAWLASVMSECLRILKPGGHALVWAIPRTSHWTATAIENAGFEIRDVVMHVFGSGFPKSLDVSKAIDDKLGAQREVVGKVAQPGSHLQEMSRDDLFDEKGTAWTGEILGAPVTEQARAWDGWGTALKPAAEHWILARKPLIGTVAENVLAHGVGGLNIAATRIGTNGEGSQCPGGDLCKCPNEILGGTKHPPRKVEPGSIGRWPAHLAFSHLGDCDAESGCEPGCPLAILDEQSGQTKTPSSVTRGGERGLDFGMKEQRNIPCYGDTGGASRFFYTAKPSRAEKDIGLYDMPIVSAATQAGRKEGSDGMKNPRASSRSDGRNTHPTVKPVSLMRWLVRMICPPNGLVVDAFTGSGTTAVAALIEGCRFLGWEQDPTYHRIASARISSIVDGSSTEIDADDVDSSSENVDSSTDLTQ